MNKKILYKILFFASLSVSAYAQNTDSIAFSKFKWQERTIAKKTTLQQYHTTDSSIFNSKQFIAFIEIKKHKKAPLINIGHEQKQLIATSAFGQKNKAIAAINGTFFDMKNGGSVDYLRVNGNEVAKSIINKKRALHQKSALVINGNVLTVRKWDGTENWEENLKANHVMVSGPLLLQNGVFEPVDAVAFNTNRHPRTAVGIKANGDVILLTVDGRRAESYGLTILELAKVMKWLGCENAINLDGGGSTTLWVNDFGENGVVNYPSDNKKWDHEGERKVANVIFIESKGKQ